MSTIKIGIIGTGNMGKNHVRLVRDLSKHFELVAVFDPDKDRLKQLELESLAVESEEKAMQLADAVIIAAPSFLHNKIASIAIENDVHLFVEKPLALSFDDAKEIVDSFASTDKVLMIGHVERYNPVVTELEKILENETILAIQINRCSPMDKRIKDTDVVYDLMIHDIDILINSMKKGSKIVDSQAFGRTVFSEKNADYVQANFTFDDGVIASVVSSRVTEDKIREIKIHCADCYVVADLLDRTLTVTRKTSYQLDIGYNPVYKQENIIERVMIPNEEPLKNELIHLAYCINNNVMPKTNGADSLYAIKNLDVIKDKIYK